MNILLTGAYGFLGSYITEHFKQSDVLETLGRSSLNKYNCDLGIEIPILGKGVDIVIHAAAKAHSVPVTSPEKQDFFNVNFKGTQNLLKGLEGCQSMPKAFVFISTVSVYGIESGFNISEDAPLLAKDPYGLSKIQAEQLVVEWCKKNDVICTILRLPLLAGINPPGNLGAMIKGIRKGYYFNIAGGSSKKSMVLASDVAKYLLKVSEIGGIYNLTDGYSPSFFELSENISRQLGKNKPINLPLWLAKGSALIGDFFGAKAPLNSEKLRKITSDLTFDDTYARESFGWDPTPVLEGFNISDKN